MPVTHYGLAGGLPKKPKKWRKYQVNRDKFGRKYGCWIDLHSGEPTSLIDVLYSAPVILPQHCLTVPEDAPRMMRLEFRRYITELQDAEKAWWANLAIICEQLYGEKANVSRPTRRALTLAGPRPQNWRLVLLAANGDPWALGFQKELTDAARKAIGAEEAKKLELERRAKEATDELEEDHAGELEQLQEDDDEGQSLEFEESAATRDGLLDDGSLEDFERQAEQDLDEELEGFEDADERRQNRAELDEDDADELEESFDREGSGGRVVPLNSGRNRHKAPTAPKDGAPKKKAGKPRAAA